MNICAAFLRLFSFKKPHEDAGIDVELGVAESNAAVFTERELSPVTITSFDQGPVTWVSSESDASVPISWLESSADLSITASESAVAVTAVESEKKTPKFAEFDLLAFPDEVLLQILNNVDVTAVIRTSGTCKYMNQFVKSNIKYLPKASPEFVDVFVEIKPDYPVFVQQARVFLPKNIQTNINMFIRENGSFDRDLMVNTLSWLKLKQLYLSRSGFSYLPEGEYVREGLEPFTMESLTQFAWFEKLTELVLRSDLLITEEYKDSFLRLFAAAKSLKKFRLSSRKFAGTLSEMLDNICATHIDISCFHGVTTDDRTLQLLQANYPKSRPLIYFRISDMKFFGFITQEAYFYYLENAYIEKLTEFQVPAVKGNLQEIVDRLNLSEPPYDCGVYAIRGMYTTKTGAKMLLIIDDVIA